MTYLLDTHVLLWALGDDARLSARARKLLGAGKQRLMWSAASTWELAVKVSAGKISFRRPLDEYIPEILEREGVEELPVRSSHAACTERLPLHHRDPFDRLLIAQADVEGYILVTSDSTIRKYAIETFW